MITSRISCSLDGPVEPQAVRYLPNWCRIAKNSFAPADDHGNLCRRDLEPVQYFLNARIVVEIDIRVYGCPLRERNSLIRNVPMPTEKHYIA